MASSHCVYDLALDCLDADSAFAEQLARSWMRTGLRSWSPVSSRMPGTDLGSDLAWAVGSAHSCVRVLGASGVGPWLSEPGAIHLSAVGKPDAIVLAPGCPIRPRDLPAPLAAPTILDGRDGLAKVEGWEELLRPLNERRKSLGMGPGRSLERGRLKEQTRRSYDLIAEKFAARWFDHPPALTLEEFLRRLPRRARVLDAGCGPGHHARFMARVGHEVTAVDLSEGMLRIARARVHGVRFARMDIQALSFPGGSFDGVWCAAAGMHIPREEILRLFRSFHDLVRPGGVVGVSLQVGRRSEIVQFEGDGRFFEYYRDQEELAAVMEAAGLQVVAKDVSQTPRNTHDLPLLLRFATLFAQRPLVAQPRGWAPQSPSECAVERCSQTGPQDHGRIDAINARDRRP